MFGAALHMLSDYQRLKVESLRDSSTFYPAKWCDVVRCGAMWLATCSEQVEVSIFNFLNLGYSNVVVSYQFFLLWGVFIKKSP